TPYASLAGSAVTLSAQAFNGTAPYRYDWDLTNSGTFSTTGQTISTTFGDPGVHTVRVRATDAKGLTSIATTTVTVAEVPPTASTGGPYSTIVNQQVTFHGSATDPSPAAVTAGFAFAWSFGDGSTGTGASPVHSYAQPGQYNVSLTATDK